LNSLTFGCFTVNKLFVRQQIFVDFCFKSTYNSLEINKGG